MTIAVDLGREATKQTKQEQPLNSKWTGPFIGVESSIRLKWVEQVVFYFRIFRYPDTFQGHA